MQRILLMLSLAALLAGMSSAARADLSGFLQSVNQQALNDIRNFNERLSRQFGIPVPDVEAIVKSVPKPADAFMILQLGQMAHVAPAVVLQEYRRSKGQGWGVLAQRLGIKPGSPEFKALKRGELSYDGAPGGRAAERKGGGREREHGNGRGKGPQKD